MDEEELMDVEKTGVWEDGKGDGDGLIFKMKDTQRFEKVNLRK